MAVAASVGGTETIWRVTAPLAETTHGVSLARPNNMFATAVEGGLSVTSADGNADAATFLVVNGIAGSGVSFESLANRGSFLMHEPYDTAKTEHNFLVTGLTAEEQLKRATFNVEEADCADVTTA